MLKKKEPLKTVSIRLTESEHKLLKQLALDYGITQSELLSYLINDFNEKSKNN